MKEHHLSCIDGLKGIGSFIIAFIWHYQHFAPHNGYPFYSIFMLSYKLGANMADLFFLLSGFGMMLGYGKKICNNEISFKEYIYIRFKRLYPLFFLTLIIVLILEPLYYLKTKELFVYSNYDIYHIILNVLFLQNGVFGIEYSLNGPSWCIPVLMVCYIIFFAVLTKKKDTNRIICSFALLAILGLGIIVSNLSYPLVNLFMGRGVAGFSVGVLLAQLYKKKDSFNSIRLGYCCIMFLILVYVVLRFFSIEHAGNITMAMIIGIGPMIMLGSLFVPWINKALQNAVLLFLGKISWDIYMIHFPIQLLVKLSELYIFNTAINYSSEIMWIAYVVITIVVATIYHYFCAKRFETFVMDFFVKKD